MGLEERIEKMLDRNQHPPITPGGGAYGPEDFTALYRHVADLERDFRLVREALIQVSREIDDLGKRLAG